MPHLKATSAHTELETLKTLVSQVVKFKPLDRPVEYRNKRIVLDLVSRLYAEWVVFGVMARQLPDSPGLSRLRYHPLVTHQDSALPSAELPGLSFVLRGKRKWDGALAREWLKSPEMSANG